MRDSYDTTLILWPATQLASSVTNELRQVGVEITDPPAPPGLAARRMQDGEILLEIRREQPYGLTDLEAVLARLRIAGLSYVAWDTKKCELAGTGRSYDPTSGVEREFTVMPDGEPVLAGSDLEEFEGRYGTAEALLEGIRAWLRLPIPENLTELNPGELGIIIDPDEADPEGLIDIVSLSIGQAGGAPGECPQLTRAGGR